MVKPVHAPRMTSWAAIAALVLSFGAAGCGDNDGFGNEPRRPVDITVSTTIALQRVSVAPSQFGAGPIELLVSNQTRTSQRLTLLSQTLESDGRQLRQTTGPINPGDTASLNAVLDPGNYTITVGDNAIDPARIDVGPERGSAQDRLLQP